MVIEKDNGIQSTPAYNYMHACLLSTWYNAWWTRLYTTKAL